MKLIKSINLNCFGDSLIKEWEQKCKEIEAKNQELIDNAPVIKREEKIFLHQNTLFGEDSRWIETDESGVKVLGISPPKETGEIAVKNQHRIKLSGFKKTEVKAQVELNPLPEKPNVKVLNKNEAFSVILEQNPNIGFMKMSERQEINGEKFYVASWCFDEVLKTEQQKMSDYDWGVWTNIYTYFKVHEYRVFENRLEIWERESIPKVEHCDLDGEPKSFGNSSVSTSLESDGFWNK